MNPLLTYQCPKVDWIGRKYDPNYQQALEMMLQRDPEKRKDINIICAFPLFDRMFSFLENECALYELKKKIDAARNLGRN